MKLHKQFEATLQRSPEKGGWTYIVMPGSADYFGTRGLDQDQLLVAAGVQRQIAGEGDALGHDLSAVTEQVFKVTFTRGVEWAATGNVTLTVPPELAAK